MPKNYKPIYLVGDPAIPGDKKTLRVIADFFHKYQDDFQIKIEVMESGRIKFTLHELPRSEICADFLEEISRY